MFSFREKSLPLNREIRNSLEIFLGVGHHKAFWIAGKVGFAFPFFACNLNLYNFRLCSIFLRRLTVSETRLSNIYKNNILKLKNMSCYKGIRHGQFLPVHGQRTRTNSGTWVYIRKHGDKIL